MKICHSGFLSAAGKIFQNLKTSDFQNTLESETSSD
jgi:hypothetical protein